MLKFERVSARIGAFSLGPLDLAVVQGTCHVLLGPSGSGKSTVLELIIGFRTPSSGRILMNGLDLAPVPVERRGIGYLPQRLALFPHLSVQDNILFGILCRRKPNTADRASIDSLAKALGIDGLMTRLPRSLSGGERQRVALARALAPAPALLVLDEPFAALNETLRRELWGLLKRLQREYRFTVLMVTHDLEEAFSLGEQISILIDGRLHQSGAKTVVFHRPATMDAAHFLGIKNLFHAEVMGEESGFLTLDCASLGTRLFAENGAAGSSRPKVGDIVAVGIRPELVALRRPGQTGLLGEVRLAGEVVDVAETGRGVTLSFRPSTSDVLLEVAVGPREAETLDLAKIQMGLPASHLFCMPAGGHPAIDPEGIDSRIPARAEKITTPRL
jgi:ABC-type Fe3+/spermidine/putrescine transport system ATPase subunit